MMQKLRMPYEQRPLGWLKKDIVSGPTLAIPEPY